MPKMFHFVWPLDLQRGLRGSTFIPGKFLFSCTYVIKLEFVYFWSLFQKYPIDIQDGQKWQVVWQTGRWLVERASTRYLKAFMHDPCPHIWWHQTHILRAAQAFADDPQPAYFNSALTLSRHVLSSAMESQSSVLNLWAPEKRVPFG